MRMRFVFPPIAVFSAIAFIIFSYMGELFLGTILAVVIFMWPTIYLLVTKVMENRGSETKGDERELKQDIIDGDNTGVQKEVDPEKEEEFVAPPKKDANVTVAKEDLEKLKKASDVLDEEKKDGILSEDTYNELKKQNKDAIDKLEQEIAKASGEFEDKKVYCKKGNHYISINDCLPSKIDGYVICQEHNEEIRAE